jgi:hypothetical protein
MQVAVWDTYVKSQSGTVLHFDIIVPQEIKDPIAIYQYGVQYLNSINEPEHDLCINECRFCHIEEPTPEMLAVIQDKGYYILEMATIPISLSIHASRGDKIMYLKAHYPQHRFQNFKGISESDVNQLILNARR